eukprot:CAMPEP_0194246210 /NCGR_PEP_ID=MMETSP0158-20130606/14660_1 /TAXON_ID=33649 /ORGANISM="Thalassionema nitzschioides, Strain L26-B" /LENGTH=920 /DNA_ID=CAMNT_0038982061 /DNA_START=43 /DNA_END=2805 /DNA_ORIENTATION=-
MTSHLINLVGILLLLSNLGVKAEKSCERLKASLSFSQEKAPRDLSGVLPVVVERVNRELDGVVDVQVDWTGSDLHGRVGEHIINCTVTRLAASIEQLSESGSEDKDLATQHSGGRREIIQCFEVPFTITDTNECTLPKGHAMAHQCLEPSMCINTIGSYECVCPRINETPTNSPGTVEFFKTLAEETRSVWEKSFQTQSSCPSSASTYDCCSTMAHSIEGKYCRATFRCPKDPCHSPRDHKCASNARCVREESPTVRNAQQENYQCVCPTGLMGNGRKCRANDPEPRPMVKFDGITPTEETKENDYYCGCTKPQVDACEGFPPCKGNHETCVATAGNTPMCACKPGYVDSNDGYGCVDESPPVLKLRHDPEGNQIMRLKQGDFYKEFAVDIIDENAEEYLRSLRITYSKPLPPGCMESIGSFHVNYTVATPWTSYQFVRVTRNVEVTDIDECSLNIAHYQEMCPSLVPQCDVEAGAKCVNTIGSYKCRCPEHTNGDGFKTISSDITPPGSYQGGTGCMDTSKPVIEILGPNPKVLKVCKCGGITGIMGGGRENRSATNDDGQLCAQQRSKYGDNLKTLIKSTMGAELCATHHQPSPHPSECVRATDQTYKGKLDITSRVEIGDPVEKSQQHWSVPYNVVDEAGNKAATAWRDVVVEEVDIFDLEHRIRREMMDENKKAIKIAVEKAVARERAKNEQLETVDRKSGHQKPRKKLSTEAQCSPCPECKSGSSSNFDVSKCDEYCKAKNTESCPNSAQQQPFLSSVWSFTMVDVAFTGFVLIVVIAVLRFVATLLYNPAALFGTPDYNYAVEESIVATNIDSTLNSQATPMQPLPQSDGPVSRRTPEGGLFSPPSNRFSPGGANGNGSSVFSPQPSYQSPFQQRTPNGNGSRNVYGAYENDSIYADNNDIISPSKTGTYRRRK